MTDDQSISVQFYNAVQCKGRAQCKTQTQCNRTKKWLTIAPGDWDTLKEHQEEQTHPTGWVIVEEFKHIEATLTQDKHKRVIEVPVACNLISAQSPHHIQDWLPVWCWTAQWRRTQRKHMRWKSLSSSWEPVGTHPPEQWWSPPLCRTARQWQQSCCYIAFIWQILFSLLFVVAFNKPMITGVCVLAITLWIWLIQSDFSFFYDFPKTKRTKINNNKNQHNSLTEKKWVY